MGVLAEPLPDRGQVAVHPHAPQALPAQGSDAEPPPRQELPQGHVLHDALSHRARPVPPHGGVGPAPDEHELPVQHRPLRSSPGQALRTDPGEELLVGEGQQESFPEGPAALLEQHGEGVQLMSPGVGQRLLHGSRGQGGIRVQEQQPLPAGRTGPPPAGMGLPHPTPAAVSFFQRRRARGHAAAGRRRWKERRRRRCRASTGPVASAAQEDERRGQVVRPHRGPGSPPDARGLPATLRRPRRGGGSISVPWGDVLRQGGVRSAPTRPGPSGPLPPGGNHSK